MALWHVHGYLCRDKLKRKRNPRECRKRKEMTEAHKKENVRKISNRRIAQQNTTEPPKASLTERVLPEPKPPAEVLDTTAAEDNSESEE